MDELGEKQSHKGSRLFEKLARLLQIRLAAGAGDGQKGIFVRQALRDKRVRHLHVFLGYA